MTSRILLALVFPAMVLSLSCSALKDVQQAITNLSRCKFKIQNIEGFHLAGIGLGSRNSYSLADGLTLAAAFSRNELPASFTLNVAAINPNDGTGGTLSSSATMTSFAWTLIIDNTITVNGNINEPITIPGTGQASVIPLSIELDFIRFFDNRGYESIVNLALALGGTNRSTSSIVLRAQPTIETAYGSIRYPGEITIVDKEFR